MSDQDWFEGNRDIAVTGMAGRFPGADDLKEFWANLQAGTESVTFFTDEELAAAGVPATDFSHPSYVKAAFTLADPDLFDADFFGYTALEARIMDPQQRLFLEQAYAALEHAGYDPSRYEGRIGVFGGDSSASAYMENILSNTEHGAAIGDQNPGAGYEACYLTTRVSYKLDLRGPSVPVQTACSTALVAIHLACQSLLNDECEMALAGASAFKNQPNTGYFAPPESVLSPDGRIYPFDEAAHGTVFSSGAGVLLLRHLTDALAARDTIYAVIKGSAINNDGAGKASFIAPGADGQEAVVAAALRVAGVSARSINYVEAHGTGTQMGDRIEIAALTQAFRRETDAVGFCSIGSVKANVGHLDSAAGMAGIVKVIMALRGRLLPPSINVTRANPEIGLASSPFRVQRELEPWLPSDGPRLAGVSAFGFGGTNAHVVVAEPPPQLPSSPGGRGSELMLLSARTPQALEEVSERLADFTAAMPADAMAEFADAAFTLAVGRQHFRYRQIAVASDPGSVADALRARDPGRTLFKELVAPSGKVAFLLSGQGSQYPGMAAEIYAREPVFRAVVDDCASACGPDLGYDLTAAMFGPPEMGAEPSAAAELLAQTHVTQPALFVLEYAMARLFESWGIRPAALIGHSLGEYVAACLAGVFSIRDALTLVAMRGRLMQGQQPGAMINVVADRGMVESLLPAGLSLAAHNGPHSCVVAGPVQEMAGFAELLRSHEVHAEPVATSRAFHSALMEPMVDEFVAAVAERERNAPAIPFISNVTGTWITDKEARDPRYWGRHVLAGVEFVAGLRTLAADQTLSLVEIGPGQTLTGLARRILSGTAPRLITSTLPHKDDPRGAMATLQRCVGQLWLAGVEPDWAAYYQHESRRRIALPGYPFQRRRHWLDVHRLSAGELTARGPVVAAEQAPHALIDRLALASINESTYATQLDPARHWVLAEHRLLGEPIVPGTAYLEIARAAAGLHLGRPVTELSGVDFLVPLLVREGGSCLMHTRIIDVGQDTVEFRIVSFDPDRPDGQQWTEHATGRASAGPLPRPTGHDVDAERSARGAAIVEARDAANADQMWFGSRWHGTVTSAGHQLERAFAELRLPAEYADDTKEYDLHPALLDLAARSYGLSLGLSRSANAPRATKEIFLPIGYDRVLIYRPMPVSVICLACPTPGFEPGEQLSKVDIMICDLAGDPVVEVIGFTVKLATDLSRTVRNLLPHARHHVVRWRQVPTAAPAHGPSAADRAVLLVHDDSTAAGPGLAAELRSAGCRVTEAVLGADRQTGPSGERYEAPRSQQGCEALFAALNDRVLDDVVYVAPEPDEPASPAAGEAVAGVAAACDQADVRDEPALRLFEFLKAMIEAPVSVSRLCVVARSVDRITGAEEKTAPSLAELFGLAKTIGYEVDGLVGRTLDIDDATDITVAAAQILALGGPATAGLRDGRCFVPELTVLPSKPAIEKATAARIGDAAEGATAGDAFLITGGAGGLGLAIARHLAATRPGVKLALTGRTELPERGRWDELSAGDYPLARQLSALRELEQLGAEVRYYPTDVARAEQVAALVRAVRTDLGRIGQIVHGAGIAGDGFLFRKDKTTFAATLSPKTAGTWNLDTMTADDPPELILFGSTIGVFGGSGQSDYTAANMFLDSFASYRSARGCRTIAIDWSDWLETGMAAQRGLQADSGFFKSVPIEAGLASFDEICAGDEVRVVVGEINLAYLAGQTEPGWDRWRANSPVRLSGDVTRAVDAARGRAAVQDRTVADAAAAASSEPRAQHVRATGRPEGVYSETELLVAQIWGRELDLDELNVFENSFDLGGNSLIALRIAQNIDRDLAVRVRIADLFRYATVVELAAHIDSLRDE
jgi:acyl transferase domain-containing protein